MDGERGEQTAAGGSGRETMEMGWRAAAQVMWKQTCGKSAGRGGMLSTAEESEDIKGQRLDSVFFKQDTMRNSACRFCATLFFFFLLKVTEVKQQFGSPPFRRGCISPRRRNPTASLKSAAAGGQRRFKGGRRG